MDHVETFASADAGPRHLSRRRLIQAFAATLAVTQVGGVGVGGPEAASAASGATRSAPAYDGIVGLL